MVNESLLTKISIPAKTFFACRPKSRCHRRGPGLRIPTAPFFALKPTEFPRFDLILLGLGPMQQLLCFRFGGARRERSRWWLANWVAKFNTYRITFTFPVAQSRAERCFWPSGSGQSRDWCIQCSRRQETRLRACAESRTFRWKIAVDAGRSRQLPS